MAVSALLQLMNPVAILLIVVSFLVLALSSLSWRLISSRSVMFNGLLSSVAILFAAYFSLTQQPQNLPLAYIIPFVVSMALDGRAIGLIMRVKTEPELKMPALYLFGAGAVSLLGSVIAFVSFRGVSGTH